MRTRASRALHGGFTLVELLLVIIVVGIIASLAMPALTSRDDAARVKASVEDLLARWSLQEEEAVLTGTQRGLYLFRRPGDTTAEFHYQWMIWSRGEGRWLPQSERESHGALLGVGQVLLQVDEREIEVVAREPTELSRGEGGERGPPPQLVVFSSGEMTEFELRLAPADGVGVLVLKGGYAGVEVSEAEDANLAS